MPLAAQTCNVDFPGSSSLRYSNECGTPSSENLTLGVSNFMGDGDIFIFDAPQTINLTGNVTIRTDGSAQLIIPAGVTINVTGNLIFQPENGRCTQSGNNCNFIFTVNGKLNVNGNLQSFLYTLRWAGTGNVNVSGSFDHAGCMECSFVSCPAFPNIGNCRNIGNTCGGSFCNSGNIGRTCPVGEAVAPDVVNCPSDITTILSDPGCQQRVSWTEPEPAVECRVRTFTSSHNPGDDFPIGTTLVTYTLVDTTDAVFTCSFNITVNDTEDPVITNCPPDITLQLSNGECVRTVNWNVPSASDNCTVASFTSNFNPGDQFNAGSTVVTYTATDTQGNSTQCSFTVKIEDATDPVILDCPADFQVELGNTDACETRVNWVPPTSTDDCSTPELTSTHQPGDIFPLGESEVVYTSTDQAGNSVQCRFVVTVVDNTPPVFSGCPANIQILAGDPGGSIAFWGIPMVTDNCDGLEVKSTHEPGDSFDGGTTEVTYTATDAAGNTSQCTFEVSVEIGDIFIYKSFTPDGDNINDTWRIENIEFYPQNRVLVMDRWGTTVFETRGYNNESDSWNGVPNKGNGGGVAPTGTYFYTIDLGDGKSARQGFIELVR